MPVNCGSSQPPSGRWVCASQRTPALGRGAVPVPGRQQREQRPGGLRRGRLAPPGPAGVVVGAQVLAPAAVRRSGALPASATARRMHGLPGRTPAAISAGHHRAGAVDVVRAPAAEPRPVALLRAQQPGHAAAHRLAAGQPLGGERLDVCAVTSADGGSMTSPKSQNGSLVTSRLVLSASKAPQPPSLDCIPVSQVTPRCTAAADRGGRRGGRPGAARAAPRRCRRCRGSRRCRTRTPSRRGPARAAAPASRPGPVISSSSTQPAALISAGWSAGRPASARPMIASTVSQTGDWQASSRRTGPSGVSSQIVNRSSPARPRRYRPGGPGRSRAGAAPSASTPRAAGSRPSDPSRSCRAMIHSAARRIAAVRTARIGRASPGRPRSRAGPCRAARTQRTSRPRSASARAGTRARRVQLGQLERQRPGRPQRRRRRSAARSSAGPSRPSRRR